MPLSGENSTVSGRFSVISTLRGLNGADKSCAVQVLISEQPQQETALIKPDQSYPVGSPDNAVEAADTMLTMLQAAKTQHYA